MSAPVAKRGDRVIGMDTHVVLVSSPAGPVPTPMPMPFSGALGDQLSESVFVELEPVATVDSVATNSPAHLPVGGTFQTPPQNRAVVSVGSDSVFVENKAMARANDGARCCNDPSDADTGHVLAGGSVLSG